MRPYGRGEGSVQLSQCPRCNTRLRGDVAHCPFDGEALEHVKDSIIGRTIAGRYLIETRLGTGGMGTVYHGRHQVIDRDVAVKFLHPRLARDEVHRKRFLGEARAANQINHENIIDVTDFGETEDGYVYLVMELLKGRSLADEIAGRRMAPARAIHIATQIATGLARAHELDVVHRDVKPANTFLLRRRHNPDFVKLLDFGIAHFERELRITEKGMLVGTPEYMSPEQLRNGTIGPATDLYALGCVLYEMITGAPPFIGTASSVMIKQVTHPAVPPSTVISELPASLDRIVLRLLHKNPVDRYRDAFHLIEELHQLQQGGPAPSISSVQPSSAPPPTLARAESPTVHVPSEEQDWRKRIGMYRTLLTTAYPAGSCPEDLTRCVKRMEGLMVEVEAVREELSQIAVRASSQADEARDVRKAVGHALDELSRDESAVARKLDELGASISGREKEMDQLSGAIAAMGRDAPMIPAAGQPLAAQQTRKLIALVEAARTLGQLRTACAALRSDVQAHEHTREDLQFQIAQLKGRLGTANAESGVVMVETGGRTNELELRIAERMEKLVPEATRLAERLGDHPAFAKIFGERPPSR